MNKPEYQQLRETSWRRRLNEKEQAALERYLAGEPLARREWEEETRLKRWLAELPPAPVSSNFTARVLEAVRRKEAQKGRGWRFWLVRWLPLRVLPRVAIALLMVSLSLFSIHQYQAVNRARTAQTLASVSRLANLPGIEWQDFDTISQLSRVEVADTELLAALE